MPSSAGTRVGIWIALVAGLVSIAAVAWVTSSLNWRGARDHQGPFQSLRAATNGLRPFRSRVTGGFDYAPFRAMRAVEPSGGADPVSPAIELAAARLQQLADEQPTPEHLTQAAIARLFLGDEDRAVTLLERAAQHEPTADVFANLAAAYLARGDRHGSAEDVVRALEAGVRATELDPRLNEGWANLGSAMEQLGLREPASRAWSRAAGTGPRDGWQSEASAAVDAIGRQAPWETHLDDVWARVRVLDSPLRPDIGEPDAIRWVFERRLIVEWAHAALEGRPDASLWARRARATADAILEATGDRQSTDTVTRLATICQNVTPSCREVMSAYLTYIQGRDAWDIERTAEAYASFTEAQPVLRRHAMPESEWIDVHFAIRARYAGDFPRVEAMVSSVLSAAGPRGHTFLAARVEWLRGLVRYEQGRFGDSETWLRRALAKFERLQERESQGAIHNLLADYHRILEERTRAWEHQRGTLDVLPFSGTYKHNVFLQNAAAIAGDQQWHRAALEFRREGERAMRRLGAPVSLALAIGDQASDLASSGNLRDAMGKIGQAHEILETAGSSDVERLVRAWLAITEARVTRNVDPGRAVGAATRAVSFYDKHATQFMMPEVLLVRGQAKTAQGDFAGAEADWRMGLRLSEKQGRATDSPGERIRLRAARWDFYSALVDLYAEHHADTTRALDLVEGGRARELLAHVDQGAQRGGTISERRRQLGPGMAVVLFCVSDARTHVWVVSRTRVAYHTVDRPVSELAERVSALREQVMSRTRDTEAKATAADLFDLLLGPVRSELSDVTSLVVVPDGPLSDIPFALLADRQRSTLLVDRMSILITPSMRFALTVPLGTASRKLTEDHALIIADPDAPDGTERGRLPGSRDEAARVRRLYRSRVLLAGNEATRARWLAEVQRASLLHFSGHAQPNRLRPELSRLFFAPDSDHPDGVLFAEDIERLRLPRLRLVVLAACESGVGTTVRGEGVLSLARGFLYAGADHVVATLWRIGDAAAPDLFEAFHAAHARGLEPAEALRSAQLEMRRRAPAFSLADWAAPVVVGKVSTHTTPRKE